MRGLRPNLSWRCPQSTLSSYPSTRVVPLRTYATRKKPVLRSATPGQRPEPRSNAASSRPPAKGQAVDGNSSPAPGSKSSFKTMSEERPWAMLFTTSVLFISGTGFAGLLGLYGVNIYMSQTQPLPENGDHHHTIDLTAVYDEYAPHFDKDVDRMEYWGGIMTLRSRLVKQARGQVLESAAGTGRNSEYYVQSRIKSLTIVDKSKGMLEVAEQKWPTERKGEDWTGKVRFMVGDVEDERTMAKLAAQGEDVSDGATTAQFDTVVQTLGLCSTDNPDRLMQSLTKLVKPGGRILLLEHGRGYFDWLNKMLDHSAHGHAEKHGCWWNRDIGAIAENSGMEIIEISRSRWSAGTNWYIILRKPLSTQDPEKSQSKTTAS